MTSTSLPVRTHFHRLTATSLSVAIPRFAAFKLPARRRSSRSSARQIFPFPGAAATRSCVGNPIAVSGLLLARGVAPQGVSPEGRSSRR